LPLVFEARIYLPFQPSPGRLRNTLAETFTEEDLKSCLDRKLNKKPLKDHKIPEERR